MRNSVFVRTKWVACLLLLCGVVSPAVAQTKPLSPGTAKTSWAQLPPAAQVRISEAIGRDQAPYHALAIPKGFRLKDPRSGLQAEFTRQGVSVKSGTEASWSFKLDAYGSGNKLRAVSAARPRASGNRVEYRRGALVEWYVNGPSGLEQGFTLAKAPPQGGSGTVSLALALSGDLTTAVDASNTGLVLTGNDGQPALHYTGLTAYDATGGRCARGWSLAVGACYCMWTRPGRATRSSWTRTFKLPS
jgi:trimeric autotransporter adhesin